MIPLKSVARGFILCDFNARWRQSCRYILAKSLCLEYCWCWRFIFTNYWCQRFTWFYTCSNFTPHVQWIQVQFKSQHAKIKIYLEFKRQTAKYVIWMLRIRVFFAAGIFESLLGSSDFSVYCCSRQTSADSTVRCLSVKIKFKFEIRTLENPPDTLQ